MRLPVSGGSRSVGGRWASYCLCAVAAGMTNIARSCPLLCGEETPLLALDAAAAAAGYYLRPASADCLLLLNTQYQPVQQQLEN